uniref:ATP synthase F0 subunit 8 n=1 Tax=Euprepiophis perlaceus TaxID=1410277 RepID=A0A067YT31_9SAUR|nr:ATP synthase F0 subunit 8 [Euprepiophis perlaceus]AHG24488.1 ATP synthase F0 subunit 8 [Euprepiophis perlaceus]AHH24458.1 ATP synthase F0 subunit 8 [Euprepiophis perlaceus]
MPQLDTIYILMVYLWTWTTLYLITQKIKTFMMTMNPMIYPTIKSTPTLPWL